MKQFEEKLKSVLKENKLDEPTSKVISEVMTEGFKKLTTQHEAEKVATEKETLASIKENVDKLNKRWRTKLALLEAKHRSGIKSLREEVNKLLKEDYEAHKAELAEKTKVFIESVVQKQETVVREQILAEAKGSYEKKLKSIAEAVQPYFVEQKLEEKVSEELKGAQSKSEQLAEEVKRLRKKVNSLIAEKLAIKAQFEDTSKQLKEEVEKPLIEKAKKPKITEAVESKAKTVEGSKSFDVLSEPMKYAVADIIRLSGGYRQTVSK